MKTIVALATPPLNCAIHIIRISGPKAFLIVNKIIGKPISEKPYTIQHNYIYDDKRLVDEVLLNIFVAPHSYTGENCVEINCHGGVVVAQQIIDLLVKNGCVYARNGEFSQQAYLNNKLSYSQIEAIDNLIHATNQTATSYAINEIKNQSLKKLEKIRDEIFYIMGSIEVNIDYPEYDDVPEYNHDEIIKIINGILTKITKIINKSNQISPIFNGIKVAIIGEPNVGKSSLLNYLSNEDKAIVSNIKGTTRDVVQSSINFEGITLDLLDTAGIHETKDEIEKKGIEKSIDSIQQADLVLWLIENKNINKEIEKLLKDKFFIKVYTKNDKYQYPKNLISINHKNIDKLTIEIKKYLSKINLVNNQEIILQSKRQINLMQRIKVILEDVILELTKKTSLDLLQSNFEECIILFNQLLGINFEYDKLDELFSKFCLGK